MKRFENKNFIFFIFSNYFYFIKNLLQNSLLHLFLNWKVFMGEWLEKCEWIIEKLQRERRLSWAWKKKTNSKLLPTLRCNEIHHKKTPKDTSRQVHRNRTAIISLRTISFRTGTKEIHKRRPLGNGHLIRGTGTLLRRPGANSMKATQCRE